ncbi:MAG TPA: lysylphosphatidylglycerol synthase transmembrane domain-containing protein [Kofleriaceae bacterium]|jgi:hypothetical protein
MKLAINLTLSLGMLALCVWLIWPDQEAVTGLKHALDTLHWSEFWPYLAGYVGLLFVVHLCRSLRWNHLLAPLGIRVPPGPLLAISSVGFMAILALPARLGEFVRPGLLRQRGGVTASAALGTVAVERIVDGLLISVMVFVCCVMLHGPQSPRWMMPMAYIASGVFAAALLFLIFALWRPVPTVKFCLTCSLLPRFAPRIANTIEHKVLDMIRGFSVLKDTKNMLQFLAWSVVYWGANGLGMWVLARGFHLDLSVLGAFAVMGVVGVGISLPNSPGMVGQFQYVTLLGLTLSLGAAANDKHAAIYGLTFAYANMHYFLQVAWYVLAGMLGLATPWVSFHDLFTARKAAKLEEPAPSLAQETGAA